MTCKACNKEIKLRKNGYNGTWEGKTFKNRKTGEVFSVHHRCLRKLK